MMARNIPQMGGSSSSAKAVSYLADLAKPLPLKHNDRALAERKPFLGRHCVILKANCRVI